MDKKKLLQFAKLVMKFAETKTDKGVLVSDGELVIGEEVFVEGEDGEMKPAEDGEYITEDGNVKITVKDGKVESVEEPKEEETEEEQEETKVEMSNERKAFEANKQLFEATYQEITENIYKAFQDNNLWDCYIIENTNEYAIVEMWEEDGYKLYKYQLTIGEDGSVSIGDRKEVTVKYVDVNETETEEQFSDDKEQVIVELNAKIAELESKLNEPVEKPVKMNKIEPKISAENKALKYFEK